MDNYDNLSSKEIFDRVQKSNKGSTLTGASGIASAILIPIIITLVNQMSNTNNTILIIALSIICCITILSAIFGFVIINSNKGATSALQKDLDDIEKLINDHFEQKADIIVTKQKITNDDIAKKIPKKMLKRNAN